MSHRILLVDDEEAVLDVFQTLLTRSNYVVDCARDLNEAVALCAAHHYSAAIVDLTLRNGEAEGMMALRHVANQSPRPKIVAWSGYTSMEVREKVAAMGADVFLAKPVLLKALFAQLEKLLVAAACHEALQAGESLRVRPALGDWKAQPYLAR